MTAPAVSRPEKALRDLVIVLALIVCTNGPLLFVSRHLYQQTPSWEGLVVRPVLIATALAALAMVALDSTRTSGRLAPPSPVGAALVAWFTGWAVLSSLWSVDPGITRGRALLYVGLAALAWVIADRDQERVRLAVLATALFGIGSSLVAAAFSDAIAYDVNDDLRGIYTNRNSLAPLAAIAVIAGSAEAVRRRRVGLRVAAGAAAAVSLGVLYLTGSRTALFALCLALGASAAVVAARQGRERFGPHAVVAVLVLAAIGIAVAVLVLWGMWDDPTFAQRRTIWDFVWDKGAERPLVGQGFFVIWTDPEFISGHYLLQRGSAHGSFFEVWIGLGLVGLVPFLAVVGLALWGAVRDVWRAPTVTTWAWLALVVFLVLEHLTESFVLWFSYNWVLLMAAALRSGVGVRPRRGRETPAATVPANG